MINSNSGEEEPALTCTPNWSTGFMQAVFASYGEQETTMSYIQWQAATSGAGAVVKKRPAAAMVALKKPAGVTGATAGTSRKCVYSREYHKATSKFLSGKTLTVKNKAAAKEHGRKVAGKAVRQLFG